VNNVERAHQAWEALNRQDFAPALAWMHPEIEWRPALGPGGAEGRVYRGRAEYENWLRTELLEVWEEFHAENLDIRELPGDRILLLGELVVRGKGSGIELRTPFGQLGQLRDGLVIRLDAFPDRESAIAAAGISEPG
jgi:hypothetical protein